MSWILTIMISFGDDEWWEADEVRDNCESLDNVNAWLEADKIRNYGPLTALSSCAVDMSANLYGGGFKHFDIEGFLQIVKSQNWHDPDNLQVFIKDEEDQKFTVLEYEDL